jgi:serine/threonine protein kinase
MSPKSFKHFQILELLGRGGMGEVYLAQDNTLERKVALKFLPRDLLRDPSAQGRLLDEARSVSRVQHPNIATVHSIEEDGGIFALCMEFIEGSTLKQLLSRGSIPMKQIVKIGADMSAALHAAHEQGVIHRDIKPANVMVTARGEVKVMDFGLALRPERVVHTLGPNTYGTVQYMSPEQARGEKLTPRSDIFSFGSTMYELVAGKAPFNAANDLAILHAIISDEPAPLRDQRRDVPPALEQLIRRCMLKQIDHRWNTMSDVLEELNYILPTVEAGPRDLINELSVGLSEQRRRPQHRPDNAGRIGQRKNSTPPSTDDPWRQAALRTAPLPGHAAAGPVLAKSGPRGGRTAEFSSERSGPRSSPSAGAIGNQIELDGPPSTPRRPSRLQAVRESEAVRASRVAQATGPKSPSRRDQSGRTNVFEDLGEQLSRNPSRSRRVPRPRRESPWAVILPLAFAILIAAAAAYGLLIRAGLNQIRAGNGPESEAAAPTGHQSVETAVFPMIEAEPAAGDDADSDDTSSAAADSSAS